MNQNFQRPTRSWENWTASHRNWLCACISPENHFRNYLSAKNTRHKPEVPVWLNEIIQKIRVREQNVNHDSRSQNNCLPAWRNNGRSSMADMESSVKRVSWPPSEVRRRKNKRTSVHVRLEFRVGLPINMKYKKDMSFTAIEPVTHHRGPRTR